MRLAASIVLQECRQSVSNRLNEISLVIQCRGENAMRAVGKMTYHGDTLEGTITIKASDPEMGEMNMVNRISGRRIGECK